MKFETLGARKTVSPARSGGLARQAGTGVSVAVALLVAIERYKEPKNERHPKGVRFFNPTLLSVGFPVPRSPLRVPSENY